MPPRIAVIYCAVLEDEIGTFARGQRHIVRLDKLPQGLHNEPDQLRVKVQRLIERIERESPEVQTIVIGYGLCSRGTEGIIARRATLVLPRAHDCITLLLGDRNRYTAYVEKHPGTYWYSPGWIRHHLAPGKRRFDTLRAEYAKKYGDENADYLMEQEQHWFSTYDRATFVDLSVCPTAGDERFTQECAEWLGWDYDRQHGDPTLLRDLITGNWDDERFLIVPPGKTVRFTAEEGVIAVVNAPRP